MGFRQAAVLSPVSFFLGVLFICFTVDHRILYTDLTEESVKDGFQFYATFFNAPPAIKALLHALVGVGVMGLLSKLHRWDESAMFFDGSSLAAYVFSIAVYITVTIPCLRTIVKPVVDVDTEGDRVEALRVLCAGNTIIIVCLGGILALQAGQEYARRTEAREVTQPRAPEKQQQPHAAAVGTGKKDQ